MPDGFRQTMKYKFSVKMLHTFPRHSIQFLNIIQNDQYHLRKVLKGHKMRSLY